MKLNRENPRHSPGASTERLAGLRTSDLSTEALEYADRAWEILPLHEPRAGGCSCERADCKEVGEHPRLGLLSLLEASMEQETIEGWWQSWPTANIGVATGQESRLAVIKVTGPEGEETLADLEERYGELPETVGVERDNGRDYYFRLPAGFRVPSRALGPGVELRANGHYVMVPPSRQADGTVLSWDFSRELNEAEHPASWLSLAQLTPKPKKVEPAPGQKRFPRTDSGNAELFAHLHGDILRHDHRRGRWLLWTGDWWERDADGELGRLAKDTARARYARATNLDAEERAKEAKWATQSESLAKLDAMRTLARSEWPIADAGQGWDKKPHLLAVADGVVNLRYGELRQGLPEDRITRHTPIAWEPDAKCPTWHRFLETTFAGDQDVIAFMRRLAGYILTGEVSEHIWSLFDGTGSNGKTTFLNTIAALLGDYATALRVEAVTMAGRLEHPAELATLEGKRLVFVDESLEGARLNTARMKLLTGGSPIPARLMRENPRVFEPTFKLIISSNYRPTVRDNSEGFWRRAQLIHFPRSFGRHERDPQLGAKLLTELPGVLQWAATGAAEWYRQGLQPPQSIIRDSQRYREDQDILGGWLEACCEIGDDFELPAGQAFESYEEWAKGLGLPEKETLTGTAFGRLMSGRFDSKHGRDGRCYFGLRLRQSVTGVTGVTAFPVKALKKNVSRELTPKSSHTRHTRHTEGQFESETDDFSATEKVTGVTGAGARNGNVQLRKRGSGRATRCPKPGCDRPGLDGRPCFRHREGEDS